MQLFPSAAQIEGHRLPETIAVVSIGGALGASLRWAVSTMFDISPGSWPWPTLIVNVLGCLAIGVAAIRIERGSLRWSAIVTGLLGGFTTMSTFAVELNDFVDLDRTGTAMMYLAVTIAGGAAALAVGSAVGPTRPAPDRGDSS